MKKPPKGKEGEKFLLELSAAGLAAALKEHWFYPGKHIAVAHIAANTLVDAGLTLCILLVFKGGRWVIEKIIENPQEALEWSSTIGLAIAVLAASPFLFLAEILGGNGKSKIEYESDRERYNLDVGLSGLPHYAQPDWHW